MLVRLVADMANLMIMKREDEMCFSIMHFLSKAHQFHLIRQQSATPSDSNVLNVSI